MKRYEQFNNIFKVNDSAEIQSLQMIIGDINHEYGLEIPENEYGEKFKHQIEWLNQEV